MYFKIDPINCSEFGGLCQIGYSLFLDESDDKYSDYHLLVPVLPKDRYTGDKELYKEWLNSLPKEWINTDFCTHFCQLEPTVTDEEILFVGECALDMQYKNLLKYGNLNTSINQPIEISTDINNISLSKSRIEQIKMIDFTKIPIQSTVPYRVR